MIGRLIAVLVMIACAGVLAWHHRDDFVSEEAAAPASPEEAAYRACLAERTGHIDGMVEDGVIDANQAKSFAARADALCRDQAATAQ